MNWNKESPTLHAFAHFAIVIWLLVLTAAVAR
jgi:hypothetical protein